MVELASYLCFVSFAFVMAGVWILLCISQPRFDETLRRVSVLFGFDDSRLKPEIKRAMRIAYMSGGLTMFILVPALPLFPKDTHYWYIPVSAAIAVLVTLATYFFLRVVTKRQGRIDSGRNSSEAD